MPSLLAAVGTRIERQMIDIGFLANKPHTSPVAEAQDRALIPQQCPRQRGLAARRRMRRLRVLRVFEMRPTVFRRHHMHNALLERKFNIRRPEGRVDLEAESTRDLKLPRDVPYKAT